MTEEEKQELATLRREKHSREQETRARTALAESGIPPSFAALLIGADDVETDRHTAEFATAYKAALTEDIRTRLPDKAPVVTAPAPARAKRGIQRLR